MHKRLTALALFSLMTFMSAASSAQAPVDGEVLIVLAKEAKGEIDKELKNISALTKAPFNAFQTMKLLEKPHVKLKVGKSTDVKLPNGRTLRLTINRALPNGRYQVQVSINRPKKSDYLPLLKVVTTAGDPFFVAGQSHKGGTLVIGVRIGSKK